MKRNVAFLFLTILFWEIVCADPLIKSHKKLLRKNQKVHVAREASHSREDYERDSQKPLMSGEEPEIHHTSKPPAAANDEIMESKSKGGRSRGDNREYVKKPLAAGDTFTAVELLPVTQKLFEKVENPGEGKGIVSSAKSPQDLADKLFQAFFQTSRRIVTLTELDISGLDALQSLALAGDPATYEKFTRRSGAQKVININGQQVTTRNGEKVSQYNMLHKVSGRRTSQGKEGTRKANSRSELLKKLGKNRHLVVRDKKYMRSDKTSRKSSCRWSYNCENPVDLDTCRLKAKCSPGRANKKVDHSEYIINSNVDVNPKVLAQFRKSLSITVLDEEVEKIIEIKLLKIRPNNQLSQEIEGLSEYFRKIVLAESKGQTTPMPIEDDSAVKQLKGQSNVKKMDAKPSDSEASAEGSRSGKSKAAEINAQRA